MPQVEKLSIAVTPEMAARVRAVVEAGEYASTSEVMREALREWSQKRDERARALADIGRMFDAGRASGSNPADEVFARLHAKVDALAQGE
jgi:antitoxin ParD1/3/4